MAKRPEMLRKHIVSFYVDNELMQILQNLLDENKVFLEGRTIHNVAEVFTVLAHIDSRKMSL